jgi:NAD(P)-dependent dehydrogenase (short-subunit alcohol dehydrogenase family)
MSVVLITGCSSGFGLEAALAFARRGDITYATMRNLSKSGPLVERAKAENLSIELLSLDVDDDASVATAIAEVEERHGAIDVLVNNAGVDYTGPVETIDLDKARAVMETNFWGPIRCMRAALPAMRAKGGAVIINVSSASGQMPGTPYGSWYSVSKHALNTLTEAMFIELDGLDVRIACIEPGFFRTDITRNAGPDTAAPTTDDGSDPYLGDQTWLAEFFDKSVVEGGGDPVDVAEAIVRAAYDPATPVHNLIGDDAFMLIDLYRQAGSIEAWLPVAVSFAESVAGPRPPRHGGS